MNESMFSQIDLIRQDSKDVRDFVKKVFSDREFKSMSKDTDFIKYLKSIYEGVSSNESVVNEANLRLNKKVKSELDAYLKGTKINSPEHQHAIMMILKGALTDANFHSEAKQLPKFFPKAKQSKYVGTAMEGVIEDKGAAYSKAAKWDGHDIIDAFSFYTSMTIGGSFGKKLETLKESISESVKVNEAEIKWNAVDNAIVRYIKQNVKVLEKPIKARDEAETKKMLKGFIDGLVNAQRSLNLKESVNEAYVVLHSPKKGVKPVATAAYADKKDAEKWAKDLGGITMIVKQKIKGIDESVNEDKSEIKGLVKKVGNKETKFYDILTTIEEKYGKQKYRIWLEKSLKAFGKNPKHYDYRTNAAAEEALYQLGK